MLFTKIASPLFREMPHKYFIGFHTAAAYCHDYCSTASYKAAGLRLRDGRKSVRRVIGKDPVFSRKRQKGTEDAVTRPLCLVCFYYGIFFDVR